MTQQNTEPEPSTTANANQADAPASAPLVAPQIPDSGESSAIVSTTAKSKRFDVLNNTITLDDIRKIANVAEEVIQQSNFSFNRIFLIEEHDKKHQSESSEIFKKSGFLDGKSIKSIAMRYYDSTNEPVTSMTVTMDFSSTTSGHVSISSNDGIWVDGVLKRFSDIIRLWEIKSAEMVEAYEIAKKKDDFVLASPKDSPTDDRVSETRKFTISNVIVDLDNLRDIAKIIDESAGKIKTTEFRRKEISIKAYDGSEYKSASNSILSQGGILDTKQIQNIRLRFFDYQSEDLPSITVSIAHGDSSERSHIEVSGNDTTWVNGVLRRFEDTVRDWEPQATWPRQLRWVLSVCFSAGIARLMLLVITVGRNLNTTVQSNSPNSPADSTSLIVPLILGGVVSAIPFYMFITDRVSVLWPNVELRTGREYAQVFRKRRNKLWAIMSLIVLPLLVTFLYDLLKPLFQ